ncbi:hypothetical protein [Nicoliella lavandulae]|uniref:Bacilysin biosynthesis protein BacA n=1 Tax=Nicoliella lavandulae TaxID=3082954 RepID=A0ABU8SMK0_9LACO
MTNLHTLGPKATDSFRAAQYLIHHHDKFKDEAIVLHDSFETIYQHLKSYSGDYFLVPTAYQSRTNHESWASNNYYFWQDLSIVDTFFLPTYPMLLVENQDINNHHAVLHAATNELMNQFESTLDAPLERSYVTSKPLAKTAFAEGKFQYAIFSKPATPLSFEFHDRILQEYHIDMVWCVYEIN